MIDIKTYRSEWKYALTNQELSLLKSRLSEIMEIDSHAPPGGKYIIHSLYFDDYKDIAVYTTDSGLSERYKWRIRYYGNDLTYIVLEKKEKVESRCHKESCRITLDEYNKIVSGDIVDLVFDTDKKLVKQLAKDMLIRGYKPKVIIDYERIAFVDELTDVRITFDMKISASYELENFLDGNYQNYYIMPSGTNLLEVKFTDILPSHIRNIVESYSYKQCSFSKYYFGRKILDCYMR